MNAIKEPLKGEMKEAVVELAVGDVVPSATNPRKRFDETALQELARTIEEHGVMQPLLVRRKDGEFVYEIIAGERRWRASKLAKRTHVPCIVKDLPDQKVIELQYIENLARADLSALEEAEGFAKLLAPGPKGEKPAYTPESLAAKLGKSRSHIFGRLRLARLAGPAREALESGKIPQTIAGLIAQLPRKELQAKFLKEITRGDEVSSFRWCQEELERRWIRQLEEAEFDRADANLLKCGSCEQCPKRTGNIETFEDREKRPNVCTDVACFDAKTSAHRALKLKAAEKNGQQVIRAAQWTWQQESKYQELDEKCYDVGLPYPKYAALVKKAGGFEKLGLKLVLVESSRKGVIEVVKKEELKAALAKAGVLKRERGRGGGGSAEANYRKEAQATRFKEDAETTAIVAAVERAKLDEEFLRDVAGGVLELAGHYRLDGIARRRGMKKKGTDWNQTLEDFVTKAKQPELLGLIVECIDDREAFATRLKVDLAAAVKRAMEAEQAKGRKVTMRVTEVAEEPGKPNASGVFVKHGTVVLKVAGCDKVYAQVYQACEKEGSWRMGYRYGIEGTGTGCGESSALPALKGEKFDSLETAVKAGIAVVVGGLREMGKGPSEGGVGRICKKAAELIAYELVVKKEAATKWGTGGTRPYRDWDKVLVVSGGDVQAHNERVTKKFKAEKKKKEMSPSARARIAAAQRARWAKAKKGSGGAK